MAFFAIQEFINSSYTVKKYEENSCIRELCETNFTPLYLKNFTLKLLLLLKFLDYYSDIKNS